MQQYRDNRGKLITDTYIHLDYIRSLTGLLSVFDNEPLQTNIENCKRFIADLEEQEEKSPRNKDTGIIYGVVLSFLLDQNSNGDQDVINKLADQIRGKYPELPYYCYVTRKGKAVFINFYLCEREYSPSGIKIEVRAGKDLYRNSKTGKACKEGDADAVLYRRAGDVIRTTESKFTKKKDYFRYATEKQFLTIMGKLKQWYINVYERVLQITIKAGISFKKFILNKTRNKATARIFNTALAELEEMYKRRYNALEYLSDELNGQISRTQKGALERLYRMVDKKIRNAETFTYNKKIKFTLDLDAPREQANENAELLKDYFQAKLLTVGHLPTDGGNVPQTA